MMKKKTKAGKLRSCGFVFILLLDMYFRAPVDMRTACGLG